MTNLTALAAELRAEAEACGFDGLLAGIAEAKLDCADRLDALAREGWMPIESAPREREPDSDSLTPIILLALPPVGALKHPGARRVFEGRWCPDQGTWTSVNGFILLTGATHWRPLPPPPTGDA